MRLGIMQPYFFPYLGYWQLLANVDKYVVYDDVTYIKGGWINRNNFLINGQKNLLTMRLEKASSYTLIKDIAIKDDFVKFLKTIEMGYKKAPFFEDIFRLLKDICQCPDKKLGQFLFNSHIKICEYLGIDTELILSSSFEKHTELKGKDKVISICKQLGADEYINAIGGQELYDKKEFAENGIRLNFIQANLREYRQLKNEFVAGLSIIDIMMFNSKEEIKEMLNDFKLV
ncbi:MAG: WbqC family protein [Treponema sp.]|nr:WbqC family protein [Treponema sp.]MEE1247690.1 WbqC family protein [Lachnospiraceae bacterium]